MVLRLRLSTQIASVALGGHGLHWSSAIDRPKQSTHTMAEQIQKQVEFYFSDSNFRRDKFLQEATTKYEGGFIPFSVLFTFKKLAAMTTDPAVLHAAIATSDVVEVNENKDALRRKHALPEADDSKARTIVFAGLGTELPSIDDIKEALAAIDVEPLYVYRKNFNKKFAGVAHVEFKDVETLKKVQNEIEKVSILKRTPSALPLAEFHALTPEDQVEFEKSVRAMLVAKDVPVKHISTFFNALQPVWDEEPILRSRVKLVPESKELYLLYTQPSFAERVLEHVNGKHPVVIDGTTLSFELVTDKAAIAARPRTVKTDKKKDNKRKRENDGKAIHISNIAPRVRMDDIKKLLAQVMDPATRSPFIEYDGMDTAKFIINDAEAAKALFDKLVALGEKAELGGQQVQFHLLEPSEELQVEIQYEKGLIVQFSEVDGEVSRDDIKNTINEKLGDKAGAGDGVAFIKYQINDKSGFLRVTSAALAQDVLALFQAGFEVNGVKLNTAKLVEGDEEKQFWVDARTARSSRFKQSQKNKNQMKRGRKY